MKHNINKYDKMLFLILFSLATGSLGGVLIPTRIIALLFLPFLNIGIIKASFCKPVFYFFVAWLCYGLLSLAWTSDLDQGLKEMVYYPIHMLLFLEIVCFSILANRSLNSIAIGWLAALVCTSSIALWELTTGNHLAISKWEEDSFNVGGLIINHQFASVTFGNYNGYVVFLIYTLPIILYSFIASNKKVIKYLSVFLLATTCYTLFMNSSRGGLLSMLFIFATFFIGGFKLNEGSVKGSFYTVAILAIFLVYYYWADLSFYLLIRTSLGSENEEARWDIWRNSFACLYDSGFLGTGIGSIITSMRKIAKAGDVIIPHNMFLEFAVQYGLLLSFPLVFLFFKLTKRALSTQNIKIKTLLLAQLCSLPFVAIIDSSYLLNPATWCFFACMIIFSYNEYFNQNI